jgi:hypothetical protein
LDKGDERPRKRYKDYDFYISTWNVLRLKRAVMLKQVKIELQKYIINNVGIQEIIWKESGVLDAVNSGNESNTFGTDYLINKKYKQL